MTKKRSAEIRRVMRDNPDSTVMIGHDMYLTRVCSKGKHQIIWIDYQGRVSEIDLGPRGARVIA